MPRLALHLRHLHLNAGRALGVGLQRGEIFISAKLHLYKIKAVISKAQAQIGDCSIA